MWTLNCFETGLAYLWTMSDMVKYRAAIWSFFKLTALYFTMSIDLLLQNCAVIILGQARDIWLRNSDELTFTKGKINTEKA